MYNVPMYNKECCSKIFQFFNLVFFVKNANCCFLGKIDTNSLLIAMKYF